MELLTSSFPKTMHTESSTPTVLYLGVPFRSERNLASQILTSARGISEFTQQSTTKEEGNKLLLVIMLGHGRHVESALTGGRWHRRALYPCCTSVEALEQTIATTGVPGQGQDPGPPPTCFFLASHPTSCGYAPQCSEQCPMRNTTIKKSNQ